MTKFLRYQSGLVPTIFSFVVTIFPTSPLCSYTIEVIEPEHGQNPPLLLLLQHHSKEEVLAIRAIPQAPERPVGKSLGRPARHCLEPVGDGRSVKVHCHQWGGHPQHQAETEGRQGKGRSQARGTGRGGVGAFRLEVTQERRTET